MDSRIDRDNNPYQDAQGELGTEVLVTSIYGRNVGGIGGAIVRDDIEEFIDRPRIRIIQLDDGTFLLGSECEYSLIIE